MVRFRRILPLYLFLECFWVAFISKFLSMQRTFENVQEKYINFVLVS
jgi:peptidoglycan/LPS O-acetylase OafA/YrhL